MGNPDRELPDDFAGRLRAARAYAGIASQKALADELNVAGASSSSLKVYEKGRRKPPPLTANRFVAKLAATTGLPEAFFWGEEEAPELNDRLDRIEAAVSGLSEQLEAMQLLMSQNVLEVMKRLGEVQTPQQAPRSQRPA